MSVYLVISDCGDGSSTVDIMDEENKNIAEQRADEGDDQWASGDGLQAQKLWFPEGFDVDTWVKKNFYGYYKFSDYDGEFDD